MTNAKGNTAPNQFIIQDDKGVWFQSYSIIIAHIRYGMNNSLVLDDGALDYSATTLKFLKIFMEKYGYHTGTKGDMQKRIDMCDIKTKDLN